MMPTCGYMLACLAVGYALVGLLYRKQSVSWSFTAALSILLGSCALSLIFFYLALAGIRPGRGALLSPRRPRSPRSQSSALPANALSHACKSNADVSAFIGVIFSIFCPSLWRDTPASTHC